MRHEGRSFQKHVSIGGLLDVLQQSVVDAAIVEIPGETVLGGCLQGQGRAPQSERKSNVKIRPRHLNQLVS